LHFSKKNKREKVPQVTKLQSYWEAQILMDDANTVSQFWGQWGRENGGKAARKPRPKFLP
jgi:hypothetical protein